MTSDFAQLRKSSSLEKLQKALENTERKGFQRDERYWQPTVDKAGNGFATIRFLPAGPSDGASADPFVILFSHAFRGPTGRWYIENSRTTLGESDPVSDYNKGLYESGSDTLKKQAQSQKCRVRYISNILVVNDPEHPENNGKVFLYSYGKKIMDKINDASGRSLSDVERADPDTVVFNPFDMWGGADFKLKIRQLDGYRNYDKSEFSRPSAILGGDEKKLEALWKQTYGLKAEIVPDKFKSFTELKDKLDSVLGLRGSSPVVSVTQKARSVAEDTSVVQEAAEVAAATKSTVESDDEVFAELAKLAED